MGQKRPRAAPSVISSRSAAPAWQFVEVTGVDLADGSERWSEGFESSEWDPSFGLLGGDGLVYVWEPGGSPSTSMRTRVDTVDLQRATRRQQRSGDRRARA
jgi:hypothetical protein